MPIDNLYCRYCCKNFQRSSKGIWKGGMQRAEAEAAIRDACPRGECRFRTAKIADYERQEGSGSTRGNRNLTAQVSQPEQETKMKAVQMFKASDGQIFESEEECAAHEAKVEQAQAVREWAKKYHERPAEQTRAERAVMAWLERQKQLSLGLYSSGETESPANLDEAPAAAA